MKTYSSLAEIAFILMMLTGCKAPSENEDNTLKAALDGKFLIGTAMSTAQILGRDTQSVAILHRHFNAIVAENCMKSEAIQPIEGKFNFAVADRFVDFGTRNNLFITGHVLIWHSQAPRWLFVDSMGREVNRDVLIQRMKSHITTVVSRYKGRVKGWDVVNEAINDDGSWRENNFYKIIGKEYVKLAFQFAHEADPDAELYYNDYSMASPGRRQGVIRMIKELQEQGIKVDGIGMQCHISLWYPDPAEFEKSIIAFAALGPKVMITEMDITVLPDISQDQGADVSKKSAFANTFNPYPEQLPDSVADRLNERYLSFFKIFLNHRNKISRVTVWGITDANSWRNNWPVHGRKDYPLLFDRNFMPKPVVQQVIDMAKAGN